MTDHHALNQAQADSDIDPFTPDRRCRFRRPRAQRLGTGVPLLRLRGRGPVCGGRA